MSDNGFKSAFRNKTGTMIIYICGVVALVALVLVSLLLSSVVWKDIEDGMLTSGTFWKVIGATFAQVVIILIILGVIRVNVEKEGWEYISKLRTEVATVSLASTRFADDIIPSFISIDDELPVQPEILTQLRQDLVRLDRYIEGAELFRRNIVSFSDTTSDMPADFFRDPFLTEKSIEQVRFLGTGRGAFGPAQLSYHFFQNFTDFLSSRRQLPLFSRFMIVGPSGNPDHFCMRYFILRLVRWVFEQRANLSMAAGVSIEAVYPQTDAFPSLLVLGNQKVLLSYSIGHVDGDSIGLAVPMGIQISQVPVTLPSGKTVSLSTSITRIRNHFDATFRQGGVTPEVWHIHSNGEIFLKNFNLGVTVSALEAVTVGTDEDREKVEALCRQVAQRSTGRVTAQQRVTPGECSFLEECFSKYSNQEL